ncbi:ABC transporter permease [Tessaracoccus sp. OS52]|uniref:ABC transporter permease n=1 Tax=Tessaracoccus sp. OS52 TaxID=2886691 RepID=UPI001D0FAB76|nr:ABC transporter permease [Tessaracoccus sp. OS52]MCC2594530.1 ABC transporter permease [Tessaracoccus sp. OS52]
MARTKNGQSPTVRVYTPHKAGLPDLREYFGEVFRRMDFARELSDTNMRAGNTNTVLGQAWLIINPLLLAGVYYLLIVVIGGRGAGAADFAGIAGGLFLYFLMSGAVQSCATSVTNAGSLILNMNFPKQLLIVSNVYLALRRFVPTLVVYLVIHAVSGKPWTLHMLWIPYAVLLIALFSVGLGSIIATWHVYFRDTAQFLPYFIRIWMYVSPVLYPAELFLDRVGPTIGQFVHLNPLFSLMGIWGDILNGLAPEWDFVVIGTAWAVGMFVVGVLYFISRERDFAVRL